MTLPTPAQHCMLQSNHTHACGKIFVRTYYKIPQKTGHDLVQLATCSRGQQPSSATFLTAILNTNPAQSSSASISNKHSPQPSATSIPNRYYQQPFQQLQGNSKWRAAMKGAPSPPLRNREGAANMLLTGFVVIYLVSLCFWSASWSKWYGCCFSWWSALAHHGKTSGKRVVLKHFWKRLILVP